MNTLVQRVGRLTPLVASLALPLACGASKANSDATPVDGVDASAPRGSADGAAPVDAAADARVTAPDPYPSPRACTKSVGTGSGAVDVQQAALGLVDGDVVCVRAGAYTSLNVSNITASAGKTITVQNDGIVTFSQPSSGSDLTNVVLSGAGRLGSPTANGFQFRDISYRALDLSGALHGLTLEYLDFENIGDYTINAAGDGQTYDGTDASGLTDLKLLHCRATNFGLGFLNLPGHASGADLVSVAKRVEVAYNDARDSPKAGYVFYLGTAFLASVHHNHASGIALQLAQHNGIVFLNGDGVLHHNYFERYLGEGMRLWPFSYGQVGQVDVYANLFFESQKYSPVEVQAYDADVTRNAQTHFSNVRIFNNTCGDINLQTMLPDNYVTWVAGIVDTYDFGGGTVEITNNLAFNIQMQKDGPFVNAEGAGVPTLKNNLYFATFAAAGLVDARSGRLAAGSPAIGAGAAVPGLADDFYGKAFGAPPDVGAVRAP
jgi:hypothetical protein